MKREPDHEELLSDVLSEAVPADFRQALLGETLHAVRRRRRWRHARRAGVVFAALGLFAALVWRTSVVPRLAEDAGSKGCQLVRSQPLPAGAIVATRTLAGEQLTTSIATANVVRTIPGAGFRVIGDDELLALVAPRPAALVRLGPDTEQLVFVYPEDEEGFPVN